MSSGDFSTPEKRRKNWQIVKRKVLYQRQKIHSLQMNVRRLKLKINSMTSLLDYLKEKSLITESSEATIKVSSVINAVWGIINKNGGNLNNLLSDPVNISADNFNKYFSEIAHELTKKIELVDKKDPKLRMMKS